MVDTNRTNFNYSEVNLKDWHNDYLMNTRTTSDEPIKEWELK